MCRVAHVMNTEKWLTHIELNVAHYYICSSSGCLYINFLPFQFSLHYYSASQGQGKSRHNFV